MSKKLDMDKIARALGAERLGTVPAKGGYFGALQLVAEIEARFRVPSGGGRPRTPPGRNAVWCRWHRGLSRG